MPTHREKLPFIHPQEIKYFLGHLVTHVFTLITGIQTQVLSA